MRRRQDLRVDIRVSPRRLTAVRSCPRWGLMIAKSQEPAVEREPQTRRPPAIEVEDLTGPERRADIAEVFAMRHWVAEQRARGNKPN